jgi:hypothetical protein
MEVGAMGGEAKVRSLPGPESNLTRNVGLRLRLTASERAILISAAEVSSMPTSSWIRYHALRVAAGVSHPPGPFQAPAARHPSDKLSHGITAVFTRAEREAIVEHARAYGLTLSSLIRKLVLGHAHMLRQPSVRSAIAAVHQAGHNLKPLLPPVGTGVALTPDQVRAIAELRGEIHALRDALLRADAAGAPDPAE